MSTEFFRKYINIINESQNDMSVVKGYVENSTQDLVGYLKDMIDGYVPRVDNLIDSLNDAYGPDDEGATEAYINQHPEVKAVRDICIDVQVALEEDEDDNEEAVIARYMPRIKKVYQMAIANGYGQANEAQVNEESETATLAKRHGMEHRQKTYGAELTHPTKGLIDIDRYGEWNHYPAGSNNSVAHGRYEELARYLKKMSGQ
jgi:hypothetical protein